MDDRSNAAECINDARKDLFTRKDHDNTWVPFWTALPQASESCQELLKCGCSPQIGCRGMYVFSKAADTIRDPDHSRGQTGGRETDKTEISFQLSVDRNTREPAGLSIASERDSLRGKEALPAQREAALCLWLLAGTCRIMLSLRSSQL
ncbi:hypothetical protein DPMN_110809 [Dreissena polymorpha]|uniref:Uncharacterized protein n=1 Tax=Dreissena polymorpha TaxID=45954 RepID=A0A9D4QPA5_DREPO|nr:hypothetical protein DPMN_110809 [Dreissena polymorpha]